MEEKINNFLNSIGLSKNEQKIYLDLIKYGKSSALDIAKRTKIHRTNVYDALRQLEERGFLAKTMNDKKRLFSPTSPEKISHYIIQQKQEADLIIPYLKDIAKEKDAEDSITMSKGNFALREALLELLELNYQINVFGAPKQAVEFFGPAFLEDFHKKRIKKKVLMRHIYNQDALERIKELSKMPFTEAKYLPKKYDSPITTILCKDRIILITFVEPPLVINIKSKQIAEANNNYFELLWRDAHS